MYIIFTIIIIFLFVLWIVYDIILIRQMIKYLKNKDMEGGDI